MPIIDQSYFASKIVSANEAASKLKNGCRVFVGSGCGEPQILIHTMIANRHLQDVMIFQMLSHSFEKYLKVPDFIADGMRYGPLLGPAWRPRWP